MGPAEGETLFKQALQAQKPPLCSSQEGGRRAKIPGDSLSGPLRPGGGRQPASEQSVQPKPVLGGDQIRTTGEMQELVKSLFLLMGSKKRDILQCIFPLRVREKKEGEPQRAAVRRAAQKEPDVGQETWAGNAVLRLASQVTLGGSPKFPVHQNLQL